MRTLFIALPRDRWETFFSRAQRETIRRDFELVYEAGEGAIDWEECRHELDEADILLTGWGVGSAPTHFSPKNLKLVLVAAGAIKHLVPKCDPSVQVISATAALGFGVAEYCLSMLVNAAKRLHWLANATASQNKWREGMNRYGPWFELYQSTVGIVGFGCSGRALATLLRPHHCNVIAYDPFVSAEEMSALGVRKIEHLDELFTCSRAVCLLAAVNESSKGMIGGRELSLLPEGAVFLNAARADLLREAEVVEELRKERLVAVIDVAKQEPPPPDHPFRHLPNVILTPHVAGAVAENRHRMGDFIYDALYNYHRLNSLSALGLR